MDASVTACLNGGLARVKYRTSNYHVEMKTPRSNGRLNYSVERTIIIWWKNRCLASSFYLKRRIVDLLLNERETNIAEDSYTAMYNFKKHFHIFIFFFFFILFS